MLRTKVVATIGPASSSIKAATSLVRAGMDVARINMSHGDYGTHKRSIKAVREASRSVGRPVAVMVDLQGPKIRIGRLPEPIRLRDHSQITIVPEGTQSGSELPSTFGRLADNISPGAHVLLNDGLIELVCLRTDGMKVVFEVIRGGLLTSGKGINLPGASVNVPAVTEKDLRDLEFAYAMDAEYVCMSFVRKAQEVKELRSRIDKRAWLVVKIEKSQALDELNGVLQYSDVVMVARGDLGVELPFASVPLAQKRIIQAANGYGRPVITATQMLESMTEQPVPTRAETSDIANAILDGTDALMLSGETAVGKYPERTVEVMVRIAAEIEGSGVLETGPHYLTEDGPIQRRGASLREHAVAASTVQSARDLKAPAIIVITRSGFSARLVSSYRPPTQIFTVCTDAKVHRQLCGVWGVRPVLAEGVDITYESLTDFGKQMVLSSGVGKPGESIIITSGLPFHSPGTTNTMTVEEL